MKISDLQSYIKENDYNPENLSGYFLKLIEEVGELAVAINKNLVAETRSSFKGSINEELFDVVYYVLAIANCYGITLEDCANTKLKINAEKYGKNS